MPFTTAFATRLRALTNGKSLWTSKPTSLYIGLLSASPTAAGGGTELSGKGYGRKVMTASDWHVYNNVCTNKNIINWPTPATDAWDQATHWAIYTASTNGTMLWYGSLAAAVTLPALGTFAIQAGGLVLGIEGAAGVLQAHRLLRYVFQNVAYVGPDTFHIAAGTNSDSDTIVGEPVAIAGASSTAYARGTIANTTARWPANTADPTKTSNALGVTNFPAATADWGQLGNGAALDGAIVTGATYEQGTTGTYGRSSNTVTVTTGAAHGLRVGDTVVLTFSAGTGGTATSGTYTVASVGSTTTFTVTDAASGSISGTPAVTIGTKNIVVTKSSHGLSITNSAFATQSASYDRSGTTVTLTFTQKHGYAVGDRIYCDFAAGTGGTATDGCWKITAVTDLTITFTEAASGSITAGTVTVSRAQHVDMWFTNAVPAPVSRRYWIANLGDNTNGVGVAGASPTSKFTLEIEDDETPQVISPSTTCVYSAANVLLQGALASPIIINSGDTTTAPVGGIVPSVATT